MQLIVHANRSPVAPQGVSNHSHGLHGRKLQFVQKITGESKFQLKGTKRFAEFSQKFDRIFKQYFRVSNLDQP